MHIFFHYFCTIYAEGRRTDVVSRIVHLHKDFILLTCSDNNYENVEMAIA